MLTCSLTDQKITPSSVHARGECHTFLSWHYLLQRMRLIPSIVPCVPGKFSTYLFIPLRIKYSHYTFFVHPFCMSKSYKRTFLNLVLQLSRLCISFGSSHCHTSTPLFTSFDNFLLATTAFSPPILDNKYIQNQAISCFFRAVTCHGCLSIILCFVMVTILLCRSKHNRKQACMGNQPSPI